MKVDCEVYMQEMMEKRTGRMPRKNNKKDRKEQRKRDYEEYKASIAATNTTKKVENLEQPLLISGKPKEEESKTPSIVVLSQEVSEKSESKNSEQMKLIKKESSMTKDSFFKRPF